MDYRRERKVENEYMNRRRPSEVECPFLVGVGYAALFWFAMAGVMGVFA